MTTQSNEGAEVYDLSSDPKFVDYYRDESVSPRTLHRFSGNRDRLIRLLASTGYPVQKLDVLDIGCGAGTGTRLWADLGHRATGIDVNEPLIALARERARRDGVDIRFENCSATSLPVPDASQDVCILPELLEHVPDWRGCVNEAVRVLRPGGVLYLSTTNLLCPKQQEYELPFYSWYPGFLKRHYERLAVTTRPELVNHATYPAINWFTYFGLSRYLRARGVRCVTHFEAMDPTGRSALQRFALFAIRWVAPIRWLALVATPATRIFGLKNKAN